MRREMRRSSGCIWTSKKGIFRKGCCDLALDPSSIWRTSANPSDTHTGFHSQGPVHATPQSWLWKPLCRRLISISHCIPITECVWYRIDPIPLRIERLSTLSLCRNMPLLHRTLSPSTRRPHRPKRRESFGLVPSGMGLPGWMLNRSRGYLYRRLHGCLHEHCLLRTAFRPAWRSPTVDALLIRHFASSTSGRKRSVYGSYLSRTPSFLSRFNCSWWTKHIGCFRLASSVRQGTHLVLKTQRQQVYS